MPELLLLHLVEPESWPPGELFDPFDCRLGFRLLSLAPEATLRELFRYCDAAELQIAAWQPEPEPEPEPEPAPEAGAAAGDADAPLRLLLDAQARLLAEPVEPALLAGRAASVAEVLRRVAAHRGLPPDAVALDAAEAAAAGAGGAAAGPGRGRPAGAARRARPLPRPRPRRCPRRRPARPPCPRPPPRRSRARRRPPRCASTRRASTS
ncbi:hypothetical protein ACFFMP_07470 [Pseudoroseomonas cervicalis]|uniref:hypothetical protein n=1 Tax=Teichococcus cervicalis TaxID=204525 RepID=UPI0035E601D8